jgi:hypothetical protein
MADSASVVSASAACVAAALSGATLWGPITDEGVAVGGALDGDTAIGMMPIAHRVAIVLASWAS